MQADERALLKRNEAKAKELDENGFSKQFFIMVDPMTASAGDTPHVSHQQRTGKSGDSNDKFESRIIGVKVNRRRICCVCSLA
jgi:hypothetical protein